MNLATLLKNLPIHLGERARAVGIDSSTCDGKFILYWLRTAMRWDENPALEAARELGQQLGLPLLVYQGLSQRYRFASDRHHYFVLEGVRDLQRESDANGVRYVFHLERPEEPGAHLRTLSAQAALVVTEDMPTQPLSRWTHALARASQTPVVCVDTACIMPMTQVQRSWERAFAFRDEYGDELEHRAAAPPIPSVKCGAYAGTLPFTPVDLTNADLSDLVARCQIDHSVPPVAHSTGGSAAGYQRWEQFRRDGLAAYADDRNDPLRSGVSRLSAYLHYGMIAPTRVAREAAANNTRGAAKFLDELLIWRELAYNFCRQRPDHGRISALPDWSQRTLREHARDARPDLPSWEQLARARSGNAFWDAAQYSLHRYGELHNNVRMTWGKQLLHWSRTPQQALQWLIDLNHRYALDGRDPCSYGGILWCLGQFDRPFKPPQPILGTVRPRPTEPHQRRLPPVEFREYLDAQLGTQLPTVAVVGAGMAGLICARTLADQGYPVTVLEKSRGTGGRMATRRTDTWRFDHGAQYFTARHPTFRRYVASWQASGWVQPWRGRICALENGAMRDVPASTERFVGVPGMSQVGKHLAADLDVRREHQVATCTRKSDRWMLTSADGSTIGSFDLVLIATPAPQTAALLQDAPSLAQAAKQAAMRPCWAVMLGFDKPLPLAFDAAFVADSPLAWIARNGSKPDRPSQETWVLHASHAWSTEHLQRDADGVARELLAEFWREVPFNGRAPSFQTAHRWRFALPEAPLPHGCLWDADGRIGAAGDWCSEGRVEGAFLSGLALAGRVMTHQAEMQKRNSHSERHSACS